MLSSSLGYGYVQLALVDWTCRFTANNISMYSTNLFSVITLPSLLWSSTAFNSMWWLFITSFYIYMLQGLFCLHFCACFFCCSWGLEFSGVFSCFFSYWPLFSKKIENYLAFNYYQKTPTNLISVELWLPVISINGFFKTLHYPLHISLQIKKNYPKLKCC